ncbi:MAG: MMPL family transporter [Spirochaetes bacterium]|nr:MMPL family transporter [Spirochaetota bacterium]
MRNIFNKSFFINFGLLSVFAGMIIISVFLISLNSSITSLFPYNKELELTLKLQQQSPIADKVLIYLEVENPEELKKAVDKIKKIVDESPLPFTNSVPSTSEIQELWSYIEENSLLLYPYQNSTNPFTQPEIKKRLQAKANYLYNMPFSNPGRSFFYDPLMMAPELMQEIGQASGGKYTPRYGGVVSEDSRSYLLVLKANFFSEEYDKNKLLADLDKKITSLAKQDHFTAFAFSAHLYFLESITKIKKEVTIIFILTVIFVLSIFYFFFKDLTLLFYILMPLSGGFALTFFFISLYKPQFGAIALAFGATISGIALDYVIHYLTKRQYYSDLATLRKKIIFPMLLSLITTLSAFLFLQFSRIESLQEISLFGLISVSSVFILSWFILQKLLPPFVHQNSDIKIKIPIINDYRFFIGWLIIVIVLIIFIPLIKFEDDLMNLDMKHKELDQRKEIIRRQFSESNDNIFLTFQGTTKDEALNKSLIALNTLKKEKGPTFFSPATLIPPQSKIIERKNYIRNEFQKNIFLSELKKSDFTEDSFLDWLSLTNHTENISISELPDFFKVQFDSLFTSIDGIYYLMIHIYDRKISNEMREILTRHQIDFHIVDIIEDSRIGLITFEKRSLILLSLSLLLIFIILAIAFKNLLYSLTAILPGLMGLLACIMVSYFTNNGFNLMHFVSAVLLIGIGVDYGIFITSAYRERLSTKEKELNFQSILVCSLTTISGFGVLSLSSNYSIFSLGSAMFAGILVSFLTTYFALPFLLNWINKFR